MENIEKIREAVDGTFYSSGEIVRQFLRDSSRNNIRYNKEQVECILASYLINKNSEIELNDIPKSITKDYLLGFGAKEPFTKYNQLQGNNHNHAKIMYEYLQNNNLFQNVSRDLIDAFEVTFNIRDNSSQTDVNLVTYPEIENFQEYWKEDLQKLIPRIGSFSQDSLIIAGTGVSSSITEGTRHSSVVTWNGLLDALKNLIQGNFEGNLDEWPGDPFEKANKLAEYLQQKNVQFDYRQYVYQLLSVVQPNRINVIGHHNSITAALSALLIPIATTNYDTLLENCLARFQHNCREGPQGTDLSYIYHLHGLLHDSTNIVLSENLETYEAFKTGLDYIRNNQQKHFIFIGCKDGAIDDHFTRFMKNDPSTHYILLTEKDCKELLTRNNFQTLLYEKKIRPVIFGTKHRELIDFLWNLVSRSENSYEGESVYCHLLSSRKQIQFRDGKWSTTYTT